MKLFPLVVAFVAVNAFAQAPGISRPAPPDITAYVAPEERKALDEAMKPLAKQARGTFPRAKAAFQAGLQKGQALFATARLYDERCRSELAFILVTGIREGIVEGTISSDLKLVTTYRRRDRYAFTEADLVDWVIVSADGAEEGNVLGKFMQSFRVPK